MRLDTFTDGRGVVLRLVTLGVLVTWVIGAAAVAVLFDVDTEVAVLIGAILTVSGPTVVIPLVRLARPREPVGAILRWEGIVIDPIGATLAIVVLEGIIERDNAGEAALRIITTLGAGGGAGLLVAVVLLVCLERHWVPRPPAQPRHLDGGRICVHAGQPVPGRSRAHGHHDVGGS